MPSFDVVSEVDEHELANAVDQANRELDKRFDFRGVDASFDLEGEAVKVSAPEEFQLAQLADILRDKLARRGIDTGCLEDKGTEGAGKLKRQTWAVRSGIDSDTARAAVKLIKQSKLKVQAQVQGEQVRVTGKKRDDLQAVMKLLKDGELGLPLQFTNFRD